jgi:hypothetical protein
LALTKNPSLHFTKVEIGLIEALALRYAAPLTPSKPRPRLSLGRKAPNVLRDVNPGAGHLLHTPSHIDHLIGDYNEGCPQLYYGHYLSHNLFFRPVSAAFEGQRQNAATWAHGPLISMVMNRDWNGIFKQSTGPVMLENCYMAPSFTGTAATYPGPCCTGRRGWRMRWTATPRIRARRASSSCATSTTE